MHWLHVLTGFQLFVIVNLLEINAWMARERFKREKEAASAVNFVIGAVASMIFEAYWIVVAVWPAVT